jgi:hypothetical protein
MMGDKYRGFLVAATKRLRAGASVVRMIAGVLTAVALCAGVGQVVGSPPSDSQAVILGEVNAYEYDAVDGVRPPPIPLAISLTAINPNDRTLSMAATVEYTGQPRHTGQPGRRNFGWPPQYVDFPSFEPIIDPVKGVLKEKYKKLEAGLTFSSASGAEVDMKVPLGELLGFYTPTTRPVTRAVTIPVDSIPQSFPNDSYELGLRVEVNLPENILFFRDRDQEVFDVIDHLYNDGNFFDPVVFGVTKDSRLTQWTLDLDGNVPGTRLASNSSSDSANMQITLSRPWWYWTFIYSVSLMPALIGLSFFVRNASPFYVECTRGFRCNGTSRCTNCTAGIATGVCPRRYSRINSTRCDTWYPATCRVLSHGRRVRSRCETLSASRE